MKFTGWLIATLLFPFVVLLVLAQGFFNRFGLGYAVADVIAILCYCLIYLFYGPNREGTLRRWLPIKAKAHPFVVSALLLFAAGACWYYAVTALLDNDCSVFSADHPMRSRWIGTVLQSSCHAYDPLLPSFFLCATGAFAAYRLFVVIRAAKPNHSVRDFPSIPAE